MWLSFCSFSFAGGFCSVFFKNLSIKWVLMAICFSVLVVMQSEVDVDVVFCGEYVDQVRVLTTPAHTDIK